MTQAIHVDTAQTRNASDADLMLWLPGLFADRGAEAGNLVRAFGWF